MNNHYKESEFLQGVLKRHQTTILESLLYFALFLFMFGSMISRTGYHIDETLDFCGGGMETYLANGRWALAAWKYVFGYGPGTWTAGILVGLFATAAVLCQLHLLGIESLPARVIYALAFMSLPQTAYTMTYSIQSDAVMFGVLATTLAVYYLTQQGWGKVFTAIFLVTISIGIYQSLALNFAVSMVLVVLIGCIKQKKHQFTLICKGIAVLISALIIWLFLYKLACKVSLPLISVGLMQEVQAGQASMVNHNGLTDLSSLAMYILHYGRIVVQTALYPHSYPGELVYTFAIIPMVMLSYHIWMHTKMNIRVKLFSNILVAFIWVSPFLMVLVMGNEWPCRPHTRLTEPIVFAALWGIVLNDVLKNRSFRLFILLLGVVAIIRGSMHVSHYAATERANFEARLHSFLRMEDDAVKLALSNNISPKKGNILYFRKMKDKNGVCYSYSDFCGQYPALRYLRYGNQSEEIEQHRQILDSMPNYPQKGSMRVNNGIIIICGENP